MITMSKDGRTRVAWRFVLAAFYGSLLVLTCFVITSDASLIPNTQQYGNDRAEISRLDRLFGNLGWGDDSPFGEHGELWPKLDRKACTNADILPEVMERGGGDLGPPITSLKSLTSLKTKALIFYPRAGLGNTLRSFKSAYVFSILSGRRLVVFCGGPHKKVLTLLCEAFHCPRDVIIDDSDGTFHKEIKLSLRPFPLTMGEEHHLAQKLFLNDSLLLVNSRTYFEKYWLISKPLKKCVFATLQCVTRRCVHSRGIRFLIGGGPTLQLRGTIESILSGFSRERELGRIKHGLGLRLKFDIAIHVRTRSSLVEGVSYSKECQKEDKIRCVRDKEKDEIEEENAATKYKKSPFWGCLSRVFRNLRKKLVTKTDPRPKLNIFLATDHRTLRPLFVEKLSRHGACYFSNGTVRHTSRGGKGKPLPTMAEFYLLSRAPHVLALMRPVSSFAEGAVDYGNGTVSFFEPTYARRCLFHFPYFGPDHPNLDFITKI